VQRVLLRSKPESTGTLVRLRVHATTDHRVTRPLLPRACEWVYSRRNGRSRASVRNVRRRRVGCDGCVGEFRRRRGGRGGGVGVDDPEP
jgi:hypothetical protein